MMVTIMAIYDINRTEKQNCYNLHGISLDLAYDINNNIVFRKNSDRFNYDSYSISNLFTYGQNNAQSFTVYDGKIFQIKQTDAVHIIDIATQAKIKEVVMNTGHGNSCQFSDEFYEEGDEFPLFYERNDGIWVYRIVDTASQLIKKLSFSADIIGTYVAGFGIDSANKHIYTVSYTQGDYVSKTGLLRICEWDMNGQTEISDGIYSLELIRSADITWFNKYEAVQGCCYFDGYVFVSCGYGDGQQYIVLISTSTLNIEHEVSIQGSEIEGCAWVDDDYLMIGQNPNGIYYRKVTFTQKG